MAAPMKNMDKLVTEDIQKILDKFGTFTVQDAREKIRCELSGHEMPCRLDALENYINGKKFKKLIEKHQYKSPSTQHLVQSNKRGRSHQLFCTLTLRHLNNTPAHIQRHLEGRRFKKALKRWEECQITGETFKPFTKRQKQDFSDSEIKSDAGDSYHSKEEDQDNLSDLYPDESEDEEEEDEIEDEIEDEDDRLKPSTSNADSDYDFDEIDTENKPQVENLTSKCKTAEPAKKTQKRKLKTQHKKPKKAKT